MRKKAPKNILIFTICLAVASSVFLASSAKAGGWVLPPKPNGLSGDFDKMILNLTNWLLGLAALTGVVALIWGAINYIGSSGDTQKADLSKRIIYYAMIGIFVAGISYAIIRVIATVILK